MERSDGARPGETGGTAGKRKERQRRSTTQPRGEAHGTWRQGARRAARAPAEETSTPQNSPDTTQPTSWNAG
eukprot:960556-Prymnesium_polylepis.1